MSGPPTREAKGIARRRRIIEAARASFVSRGIHSTGIAAIAGAADVAVAQLYRDFPSKDDIIATVVKEDCRLVFREDELNAALGAKDQSRIRSWIEELATHSLGSGPDKMFLETAAEASRNARVAAIFLQAQDEARSLLINALKTLAPETPQRELEDEAAIIIALSLGFAHLRLLRSAADIDRSDRIVRGLVSARLGALTPS